MLESLGRIQNPLVRGLTAAVTVGSAVAMAAAIALDITQAKESAAYRNRRIVEGEVNYQETPVAAIDDGSVLICISTPETARVVLDL